MRKHCFYNPTSQSYNKSCRAACATMVQFLQHALLRRMGSGLTTSLAAPLAMPQKLL